LQNITANLEEVKNMKYKNIGRHFVLKGWGFEDWIVNTEKYCGKILFFNGGKQCSWHYHKIKDETFYIQSGKIEMLYGILPDIEDARSVILEEGDSFYIPQGLIHRAIALQDTFVYEFSTQHFDSDSYRILKGD
jgi:mannose-6-phosphate isomerase-like protein (cupin superfamily)